LYQRAAEGGDPDALELAAGLLERAGYRDEAAHVRQYGLEPGVRADGTKELIALDDGHRESTESRADLLRSCKRRGMRAPVLAVGDGALGFWASLREVFPETRGQRCWFHKIQDCQRSQLPAEVRATGRKAALAEIWAAEDREHAEAAARAFAADYGTKWPKAAAKITDDLDVLLAFYDYPAEHWIHLRTTNPISSPPSLPSGSASASPRDPAPAPPASRWRSSSSSPHKPGGARSTHPTWSRWSAPAPGSRKAPSSNGPDENQEVISSRVTHRSTGLDYSSAPHPLLVYLCPPSGLVGRFGSGVW
jgi:Transposase, Mutator family